MFSMRVPACCIRAVFGFKRFVHRIHNQVHRAQHVGQHMVGLYLQVVGLELNRHVPIAQVVGRTNQVVRRAVFGAMCDAQYRLGRGDHLDERAVFCHQHVTAACHRAAWQKYAELSVLRVSRVKPAFLAHVPIQLDGCSAFDQYWREASALGHEFVDSEHGE